MAHALERKWLATGLTEEERLQIDSLQRKLPDSLGRRAARNRTIRLRAGYGQQLRGIYDRVASSSITVEEAVAEARLAMIGWFRQAWGLGAMLAGLPNHEPNQTQATDLAGIVEAELVYFRDFMRDVTGVAREAMDHNTRLTLYQGGIDFSMWRGWLLNLPSGAEIEWRITAAESCPDCLLLRAGNPYSLPGEKPNPLPTVPRNGDTRCVVDPNARVYTDRGHVPIARVRAGDLVLTHLGRWKPVKSTSVSPSERGRTAAAVATEEGSLLLTDDHLVLTDRGWIEVAFAFGDVQMYTAAHAKDLHRMRTFHEVGSDSGSVCPMCGHLRVRQEEGPAGNGVLCVCRSGSVVFGDQTVAIVSDPGPDGGEYTKGSRGPTTKLCGATVGALQAEVEGRSGHRPLLAVDVIQAAEVHISVPVGVDRGEWSSSARRGDSPQEPRLHRRPTGEPSAHDGCGTHTVARHPRSAPDDGSGTWPSPDQSYTVSDVQKDLQGISEEQERPHLLFSGMLLEPGTRLYDLNVMDDHSFVCEGLIVHNCLGQCKCFLEAVGVFRSGIRNRPEVEVVASAGFAIDPVSAQAQMMGLFYQDLMDRYVYHIRLAELEDGAASREHAAAAAALADGMDRMAANSQHTIRRGMTDREILEDVLDAKSAGLRYVSAGQLSDDLVTLVAVLISIDGVDRGPIEKIASNPPTVILEDGGVYRLDVHGGSILFVED